MSMVFGNEFESPADAYTALFGKAPGPNSLFKVTTVGRLKENGYFPVYDGQPLGHVSVYGNRWGTSTMAPLWISGIHPVIP
jgi:hypothetical protein